MKKEEIKKYADDLVGKPIVVKSKYIMVFGILEFNTNLGRYQVSNWESKQITQVKAQFDLSDISSRSSNIIYLKS